MIFHTCKQHIARKRVVGLSKKALSYGRFPPVPTPPDATTSLPKPIPLVLSPQTLEATFFWIRNYPSSPDFALSDARKRVVGLSKNALLYGRFPPVPTPPDATTSLPKPIPLVLSPQTLGATFFWIRNYPSSPDFASSDARKRVVGLSKNALSYGRFPPVPTPPDATTSLPAPIPLVLSPQTLGATFFWIRKHGIDYLDAP